MKKLAFVIKMESKEDGVVSLDACVVVSDIMAKKVLDIEDRDSCHNLLIAVLVSEV